MEPARRLLRLPESGTLVPVMEWDGKESLGQLIVRLRTIRRLTQVQLAEYATVRQSWLSKVEADRRHNPDKRMLARVAEALRMPVETLLLASAGQSVVTRPEQPRRSVQDALLDAMREVEAFLATGITLSLPELLDLVTAALRESTALSPEQIERVLQAVRQRYQRLQREQDGEAS